MAVVPDITSIDLADPFVGRDHTLADIEASLLESGGPTVLIIEGLHRAGKTQLLKHLFRPGFLEKYLSVYFTFQSAGRVGHFTGVSSGTIFYEIARRTILSCHAAGIEFDLPRVGHVSQVLSKTNLAEAFRRDFRQEFERSDAPLELFQHLIDLIISHLDDRRLLLVLDEFELVTSGIERGATSPSLLDSFCALFCSRPRISGILAGSRLIKQLHANHHSALIRISRRIYIGPIDLPAARELVRRLLGSALRCSDAIADGIVDGCACHPYLIQHLTGHILDLCAVAGKTVVSADIVKKAAELWLRTDTHFDTVWRDDIRDSRRQYVAWVVQELQQGPAPVTFDLIRQVLQKRGLSTTADVAGHLEELQNLHVVRQHEATGTHTYTIAIPLFAEWLRLRINPAQQLALITNQN